jgi:thymidine kinase
MGELHLIMGPMFSSKTSQIIRLVETNAALNIPTFVVNHSLDTRFTAGANENNEDDNDISSVLFPKKSGVFTHDGKWCDGMQTCNLSEIFVNPAYEKAKVICLDEANFFENLRENIQLMVERDHKIVHVAGLSGTYDRKEFGQLAQLIPIADSVTMLQSICVDCQDGKTLAIFTKLREKQLESEESEESRGQSQETSPIQIGGKEKYKPVCRKHFINNK